MDGEKVTISFNESWDTFYAVFRSVFKSSAPPSPIRASPPKAVIDLDVEVDEDGSLDEEEEDMAEEDAPAMEAEVDVRTDKFGDDDFPDDNDWSDAEMDDAQHIKTYLTSELAESSSPPRSAPPSMDVTLTSILLPVPVDAPVSSFELPSRCTIRVSAIRWVSTLALPPLPQILRRAWGSWLTSCFLTL